MSKTRRNTFKIISDSESEKGNLYFFRIVTIVAAILVPLFGVLYKISDPDAYDPYWWRFTVSTFFLTALVLSFVSERVRRHMNIIVYFCHGTMMIWLPILLYYNHIPLNYALGYIMAFSAIVLTFRDNTPLIFFILFSLGVSVYMAMSLPYTEVNPIIFIACISTIALVLFIGVGSRNLFQSRLGKNEKLLKVIFNGSPDAVFLVDDQWRILDSNDKALQLFHIADKSMLDQLPLIEVCLKFNTRDLGPVETEEITFQHECETLSHQIFWASVAIKKLRLDKEAFYLLRVSDISEIKRAEQEITYKQVQLENAQQLAHIGSWEWDMKANDLRWSDELYRIYGLEPGSGIRFEDFVNLIHPDDRNMIHEIMEEANRTREDFSFDHRILRADNSVRYLNAHGKVVVDPEGNITGMYGTGHDITEQKLNEQKILNYLKEIEFTNKELNRFAYIVSHDLKAPLRAIGSLVTWLEEDFGEKLGEDGKENLKLLHGRVHRMHNFIEGILEYSRIGRSREEVEKIDLDQVVHEVIDMLSIPSHINCVVKKRLPHVYMDKLRAHQVFQNLLGNAVKFIDKPEGRISLDYTENDEHFEFSVEDNGPGIDEKHFVKIFEIFQTLKARDDFESTGIGLTIVKKIIESKNGKIWVESVPGSGAVFRFTLPKRIAA